MDYHPHVAGYGATMSRLVILDLPPLTDDELEKINQAERDSGRSALCRQAWETPACDDRCTYGCQIMSCPFGRDVGCKRAEIMGRYLLSMLESVNSHAKA